MSSICVGRANPIDLVLPNAIIAGDLDLDPVRHRFGEG